MAQNIININFPNEDFVIGQIYFPYLFIKSKYQKARFCNAKTFFSIKDFVLLL